MTVPLDLPVPATPGASIGLSADSTPAGTAGSVSSAAQTRPLHVVGVDPSLTATGLACNHGTELVETDGKDANTWTWQQRDNRLTKIRSAVLTFTRGADLVVVEQPAYSRTGGHSTDRAGLFWLLMRAWLHREQQVAVVGPTQRAKYATGKGTAGKQAVLVAAVRRFPMFGGLSNDNEADALILVAMALDYYGQPLTPMPAVNRAALDKVAWPELGAVS